MDLNDALVIFHNETADNLELMEQLLLNLEQGCGGDDVINNVFRCAHTIKGAAGMFGLEHIVDFSHYIEHILSRMRNSDISLSPELNNALLKACDHLKRLVQIDNDNFAQHPQLQADNQQLIAQLQPWLKAPLQVTAKGELTNQAWYLSLQLDPECLQAGMDPISMLHYLSSLGSIEHIKTWTYKLPDLTSLQPQRLYLAYEILLISDAQLAEIENTFMFVKEHSKICILAPNASSADYLEHINRFDGDKTQLTEFLVECGLISNKEVMQNSAEQLTSWMPEEDTGNFVSSTQKPQVLQKLKVDPNRLDNLINLIGELVINQQKIASLAKQTKDKQLNQAVTDFAGVTDQVQDAALNLRMVPIGGIFSRFNRLIRDSAQQHNKQIELSITGAETELDRLMVEQLVDPLTHIIRNAVDHGIETSAQRLKKNKSEQGQIRVNAYHDAGDMVIEIADDGRGIDSEKIRQKAILLNLIDENDLLNESELQQLIFNPGLTTKDKVTELSGRGVGMDVVKNNVEALHGYINISSEVDVGTQFQIRLPLTLAIIEGFHVQSQTTHFVIPKSAVLECMALTQAIMIHQHNCINLRGQMIPYIQLQNLFKLKQLKTDNNQELILVKFGSDVAGLVVEKLHGEIQVVVKPLGTIFTSLKGIGGASLLGSGEIAFILDIPQLISLGSCQQLTAEQVSAVGELK